MWHMAVFLGFDGQDAELRIRNLAGNAHQSADYIVFFVFARFIRFYFFTGQGLLLSGMFYGVVRDEDELC